MNFCREITVAFTGHRYYAGEADRELRRVVVQLYERGFSRFLCGMAWGFDLAAGEAVLELKKEHPEVELIAVIPHRGFCKLFHGADAEQYRRVADAADGAEVVSEIGGDLSYMLRNNYLVDNASVVVAWWNGVPKGGTAYTVRRARKSGVEMINLFPDLQLDLGF